jgi:glycosyltransferase involved in cell wall biosynthesis
MRVLHVVPVLASRYGGPAIHVVECSIATRRHGVVPSVVSTNLAGPPSRHHRVISGLTELPRGVEQLQVRLCESSWPYRFAYSRELNRVLAEEIERADLVRIHSLFLFPQWAAYRHAVRLGIPYVVSFHGAMDPYLRERGRLRKWLTNLAWQSDMLNRAAAIHVTSREEQRLTAEIAPSVPRFRVSNGIDWEQFQDLPDGRIFRVEWLDGHLGPILLSLGRIARKKAPERLVHALPEIVARHPDVLLVFAGPDDEGLSVGLRRFARSLGVESRVRFTGMLHREERLAALSAATIWVLPSHTENFAVAAAEALAAGLPVVLTPQVNISSEAAAAGAAIVTEPDACDLAEKLIRLLEDDALRERLGTRAREHAKQYDWQHVGAELVQQYRMVIAGSEVAHGPA